MQQSPARAITVRFMMFAGIVSTLGAVSGVARAQGAASDQSGVLSFAAGDKDRSWLERRFAGSSLDLNTYVGSGTFYAQRLPQPVRLERAVRPADLPARHQAAAVAERAHLRRAGVHQPRRPDRAALLAARHLAVPERAEPLHRAAIARSGSRAWCARCSRPPREPLRPPAARRRGGRVGDARVRVRAARRAGQALDPHDVARDHLHEVPAQQHLPRERPGRLHAAAAGRPRCRWWAPPGRAAYRPPPSRIAAAARSTRTSRS